MATNVPFVFAPLVEIDPKEPTFTLLHISEQGQFDLYMLLVDLSSFLSCHLFFLFIFSFSSGTHIEMSSVVIENIEILGMPLYQS